MLNLLGLGWVGLGWVVGWVVVELAVQLAQPDNHPIFLSSSVKQIPSKVQPPLALPTPWKSEELLARNQQMWLQSDTNMKDEEAILFVQALPSDVRDLELRCIDLCERTTAAAAVGWTVRPPTPPKRHLCYLLSLPPSRPASRRGVRGIFLFERLHHAY
jgi:hypothetical protein